MLAQLLYERKLLDLFYEKNKQGFVDRNSAHKQLPSKYLTHSAADKTTPSTTTTVIHSFPPIAYHQTSVCQLEREELGHIA